MATNYTKRVAIKKPKKTAVKKTKTAVKKPKKTYTKKK